MKSWLHKHFWYKTWYQRLISGSLVFLKDHFIPHADNGHLPRALRAKALKFYASTLIVIKVLLTVFLFVVYPSSVAFGGKISNDVIEMANKARLESGLNTLTVNESLTQAAQAKADDMMAEGYFSHTAPNGDKPWVWLDGVDYRYYSAGENLAMDFSSGQSVHQAFMNSPTHRKNIMNSKYKEIGVAVAYGELDGQETTVLVQYFGSTEKYRPTEIMMASAGQGVNNYEETITDPTVKGVQEKTEVEEAIDPYAIAQTEGQTEQGARINKTEEFNAPLMLAVTETNQARDIINKLVINVDKFFFAVMFFLIVSLVLKIFIEIRVQHHHIIGYTLSLILFIAVLTLSQLHFVEKLIGGVINIT